MMCSIVVAHVVDNIFSGILMLFTTFDRFKAIFMLINCLLTHSINGQFEHRAEFFNVLLKRERVEPSHFPVYAIFTSKNFEVL